MKKQIVSMKRGAQKGFTLIELMIVIAIIGILSAFAVPMFQDYTVRTRVAEGLVLASSAKNTVVDNAVNGFPFKQGWTSPRATVNTASVNIEDNGDITITGTNKANNIVLTLKPSADDGAGGSAVLISGTPPKGRISWACSAASGTDEAQIPSECRTAAPTTTTSTGA